MTPNHKENQMDTFTQPKITGYRQLTQEEAALMNEGKALACINLWRASRNLRELSDREPH